MNKNETPEKKNLFVQLAQQKAAAQAKGGKFGILGKDLSGKYSKGEYSQPTVKRGGRNGSGKP